MKLIKTLPGLIPLTLLLGCSNPADNVPEATVKPADKEAVAATKAAAPTASYFAFGPEASKIDFVGSKVTGSHKGGFQKFIGEFTVVNGKLADAGNKIVIDMNSTWTDNARLTSHLKNQDFFEVPKYPTATFTSTAIKQAPEGTTVTGNLTLHGITKEISFPAKIEVAETAVKVTAEFFINRFDFDVKYTGRADDLVRKEVVLKLNVSAAPGRADFTTLEQPAKTAAASSETTRQ